MTNRTVLRTFSKGQILSLDAIRGQGKSHEPCPRSSTLTASGPFRSSAEIPPAINTHRQRSGQRFCPIHF